MSRVSLESLKRYLVLELIESSTKQNSKVIMQDTIDNALKVGRAMKEINSMFGLGTTPQQPTQQAGIPNNVFNQSTQGQQINTEQHVAYTNQETIDVVTTMQKSMIEMQNKMFLGMQDVYNMLGALVAKIESLPIQQTQRSRIDEVPIDPPLKPNSANFNHPQAQPK